MKPINVFIILSLLTIIFSFVLSGCYTQLAFVDDEQYAAVEPSPIIIIQPIIIPINPRPPIIDPILPIEPSPIDPPSPPVINPLPPAGIAITVTQPQPPTPIQIRKSGYKRSDLSENIQPASPVSEKRISGTIRGGR